MRPDKAKAPSDSVGVRELKASLSGYLHRVREGESLTVTDHGRPIARISPAGMSPGLERLVREGRLVWSGRKPELVDPPLKLTPGPSASDMVIAMRREGDEALDTAIFGPRTQRKKR